ncbi:MAG: hypothetical protein K8E66_05230, partial [Phycisphaerales bacterium]|nr:hypothetical protein [Phycisphaerales bacterium]
HFGGGGGSTLAFDFSVNQDIELISYTLSNSGFFLGNPAFFIVGPGGVLSSLNDASASGSTLNFNDGPIAIAAGETYTFITDAGGAAVQSYMSDWQYNEIPTPAGLFVLGMAGVFASRRREHSFHFSTALPARAGCVFLRSRGASASAPWNGAGRGSDAGCRLTASP